MSENLFARLGTIALCLTALAAASPAIAPVRIDSVENRYRLQDFSFEVNFGTGRAGIRLEYVNPDAAVGLTEDSGPAPKIVTVPGLTYDSATHAVVYVDGATRTVCATQASHRTAFWKTAVMKATGACKVSSRVANHTNDNGWDVRHLRTLDAYFEVLR